MHVAVCIVGYRNPEDIAACCAALSESSWTDFEVVVCENGGPQAYERLTALLPASLTGGQPIETILAPGNLGFAGGVNRCMTARPDADAWWILNPDAEPEAHALAALVARLTEGDVAAVGGTLYFPDGRVQGHGGRWRPWLARAESIGHGTALGDAPTRAAIEPQLSYLIGASMLVGRRFVDTVGLMREDYFLYGEEIEWCLRATVQGLKLGFAPDARIAHVQGTTTGAGGTSTQRPRLPIYLDERNKLNTVRDTEPWLLPIAIPATALLLVLRYARRGAWTQWRWGMAGWWSGILGRRGPPGWLGR